MLARRLRGHRGRQVRAFIRFHCCRGPVSGGVIVGVRPNTAALFGCSQFSWNHVFSFLRGLQLPAWRAFWFIVLHQRGVRAGATQFRRHLRPLRIGCWGKGLAAIHHSSLDVSPSLIGFQVCHKIRGSMESMLNDWRHLTLRRWRMNRHF